MKKNTTNFKLKTFFGTIYTKIWNTTGGLGEDPISLGTYTVYTYIISNLTIFDNLI